MLKLIAVESQGGTKLLLRFSDGAWGIHNFAPFINATTAMTAPLRDPAFFARHFIEAGALAWPNGFDLSSGSKLGVRVHFLEKSTLTPVFRVVLGVCD